MTRSPYVGLMPFSEEDTAFFFGRRREQRVVMANLRAARLTVLYGASGVGKSSVLRAGVIPELHKLAEVDAEPARERGGVLLAERPLCAVSYFNAWHDDPLPRLATAIRTSAQEAVGEPLDPWIPGTPFAETLEGWTDHVRTLLVVLDQFEEYFLYHPAESGPGTLAHELPQIVNDPNLRVNVLLSIREDAIAVLDRFKGVIPNLFGNTLRVDYLDRAAAEEAITGPIEVHNRRLDAGAEPAAIGDGLVDAVLDATRTGRETTPAADGDRVETPLLQLVMDRLWDATVDAGGHELTVDTLERELGGARRIVERHLEDALAALEDRERLVAADAFAHLVTPSKAKVAHAASALAYWTKHDTAEVEAVLNKLSSSECGHILRTLRPAPGDTERRYEIFHDVLAAAVVDWRGRYDQEREKGELAARLEREEEERRVTEHERQRDLHARIVRVAAAILLVLVLALAGAVMLAFHERGLAESQQLAARAQATLPTDPARSVALALAAVGKHPSPEAEEALRIALSTSRLRAVLGTRACPTCTAGKAQTSAARFTANAVAPGVVGWSPDGRWVASAASHGRLQAWWPRTGAVRTSPARGSEDVLSVRISSDGRWVASVDGAGAVRLWDPVGGQTRELLAKGGQAVAFSDDARYVAVASDGGTRVWRVAVLEPVRLRGAGKASVSVALTRDGSRLASMSAGGHASVWDLRMPDPRPVRLAGTTIPYGRSAWEVNVAFSRDGRRVVAPTYDAEAIYNATTGRRIDTLADGNPDDAASTITAFFTPDGSGLMTLFRKDPVRWEGGGWTHLTGHSDFITAAAYSPDGRRFATASRDGTIRIWDLNTNLPLIVLAGDVGQVDGVAFSPDGRFVVTRSADDGSTRIWDVTTGRVFHASTDWLLAVAWSADGRRFVAGGKDGSARVYDVKTGHSRELHGVESVRELHFSPDGRQVVASTLQGAEKWNLADADPQAKAVTDDPTIGVNSVTYSAAGRRLLTADGNRKKPLSVLDARTGAKLPAPRVPPQWIYLARFSADGRQIATIGSRGLQLLDARSGRVVRTFKGHRGTITAVEFSHDGRKLVSGGNDRTARVWDVRTGDPLAVMRGSGGWIASVAFGAGDRTVVTGSEDGTTRVWDAASGGQLALMRDQSDSVDTVAVNPRDGSIVSSSDDGTAVIQRCTTCAPLGELERLARTRTW